MKKKEHIVLTELSKSFPIYNRGKSKGLSLNSLDALKHILSIIFFPKKQPQQSNRFFALKHINLTIKPGEVLGIIGRNGAGKSTLLKIIAGVLSPSSGRIQVNGRIMSMLELDLGYSTKLTLCENLHLQGRLLGLTKKEVLSVENNILEFAGLSEYKNEYLKATPAGSAVKLGFAAMMFFKIDIILADEVLAVGDSSFRQICEERIKLSTKYGQTVLFVSHDMNAVRRICTRVIWIDKGKIYKEGNTQEIVSAYFKEILTGHMLHTPAKSVLKNCCHLLDLRLLDNKKNIVGSLEMNLDSYISTLVRLSDSKFTLKIKIVVSHGKHNIFTSENSYRHSGKNATVAVNMILPKLLLNERAYIAHCHLSIIDFDKDLDDAEYTLAEKSISFNVYNSQPNDSVWADWRWGKGGLISPKLDWSTRIDYI